MRNLLILTLLFFQLESIAQVRLMGSFYPFFSGTGVGLGLAPSLGLPGEKQYAWLDLNFGFMALEWQNSRLEIGILNKWVAMHSAHKNYFLKRDIEIEDIEFSEYFDNPTLKVSFLKYKDYSKHSSNAFGYTAQFKLDDDYDYFSAYSGGNTLNPIFLADITNRNTSYNLPIYYDEVDFYRIERNRLIIEAGVTASAMFYSGWNGAGVEFWASSLLQLPRRYKVYKQELGVDAFTNEIDAFWSIPQIQLEAGIRFWLFANIQKKSKFREEFRDSE